MRDSSTSDSRTKVYRGVDERQAPTGRGTCVLLPDDKIDVVVRFQARSRVVGGGPVASMAAIISWESSAIAGAEAGGR